MFRMTKALLAAAVALLAGAMTSPASAQQPTSVTGCLSKGMAEDAFNLTGTDGQTYSLTSSTVKLDQHVGHKVTVTGTSAGVETGALADTSAKKKPGMTKDTSITKNAGATGAGGLNVSSLKMVSAECK
jgi:ABC-type sugar transport system substrate-binding protein